MNWIDAIGAALVVVLAATGAYFISEATSRVLSLPPVRP